MTYPEELVLSVLKNLNNSGSRWILLRNTDDLLPDKLQFGKDIDILIEPGNLQSVVEILKNKSFKVLKNPLDRNLRWYGVTAPVMLESPDGIRVDLVCEIFVISTHRSVLIPLDKEIQRSAWENAVQEKFSDLSVEVLGAEDLFVSLASRCVFDKKIFGAWQQKKLKALLETLHENSLERKLRLVFFNFAPILMMKIKNFEFESILADYLSFKDY